MDLIKLLMLFLLIVATAVFVAAEFALVKIRASRVDQLVMENRKNALVVKKMISNLDGYLSACQLGITITALGLGWLGEPTIERLLHPLWSMLHLPESVESVISFLVAFIIVTYLHVVLGELAPKTLAIQKAEWVALHIARPLTWFNQIMYPFIWLLNGSASKLIQLFGMKPAKEHEEAHTEEELRIILSESYAKGNISRTEYGYVNRIFTFDETVARELMVPRTDMVCLYLDRSPEDNLRTIRTEQYTRFPVVRGSKDEVVGMIHTKQLFLHPAKEPLFHLEELLRPVITLPEATPVKALLRRMQKDRAYMAILVDEYGGTSGMITMEDIVEEIVGDIRDEFDAEEQPEVELLGEDHVVVDGKVTLTQVNEMLHVDLRSEDVDTVGGWLFSRNPDLPAGVEWTYDELTFVVRERESHRIRKVEIMRHADDAAGAAISRPPSADRQEALRR